MGKEASGAEESFADGLLEYPQYTRPQVFEGRADPGGADFRRPRQGRRLAARRGRAADPRAPAATSGRPIRRRPKARKRPIKREGDKARSFVVEARQPIQTRQDRAPVAGAADGEFAMNLIQQLEKEQVEKLSAGKEIPDFEPGDTVLVNVKVVEGDKSRVQAYEGVCIGRSGARHQRELHRAQDFLRRRRRARVPALLADDRLDQGRAPRQGAPRQALLPARPARQEGAHRRSAGDRRRRKATRRPRPTAQRSKAGGHAGNASKAAAVRPRFRCGRLGSDARRHARRRGYRLSAEAKRCNVRARDEQIV